jgi:uncharacterized protein YbjT (DUF2867 family)
MKLTLFAASGGVGRRALQMALERGHELTVVVRNPSSLISLPPSVRVVTADLGAENQALIEDAVRGADAVLSCLGARTPSEAKSEIAANGTQRIVNAMIAIGITRFVAISAAPVATVASAHNPKPVPDAGDGILVRFALGPIVKWVFKHQYADLAKMEHVIKSSRLNWTILRPPRLIDGNRSSNARPFVTTKNQNAPGGTVKRIHLAELMLDTIGNAETIGATLGICDG